MAKVSPQSTAFGASLSRVVACGPAKILEAGVLELIGDAGMHVSPPLLVSFTCAFRMD
jgi:hypothetical protein